MTAVTIYHNPRCSKSREALALLQQQGAEVKIVEYLKEPLSRSEIEQLVRLLGKEAQQLLRTKDPKFAEAGLNPNKSYTNAEIIGILEEHGHLMERAVVTKGRRAAIARPPERVLELLS